ncbi:MAG: hypothetical protein LBD35_02120, partial [Prevotellaceae bacterium]|nr:hypothetical protein [Prevotellaceae bacterium]
MKRFYAGICLVSIFCLGFVSGLRAQNFGTGFQTEIWLKADEVRENAITGNNVAVTVWDNKSLAGTSRDFIQTSVTAPTPIYSHAGMNFNPSVYFSAASLKSRNTFTTSSGSGGRNYMTFWVARRTALADYSCVFNYRDGAVYDEGWRRNNDAYFHGTAISFVSALGKTYGVVGADRSGGKIYRNALSGTVTPRSVPNGASTALLGARNATPAVATRFTGDIQEFILLSVPSGSSFTDADVHKINSYLMIKYGQHPESPTLVNSDGNPVWTAASSTGYTGNVFALGRDDVTGLNQKQSASVEDDVLAAFLGNTIFTLNAQNTETFALDKTYLAFGSNMLNGFESYSYPAGTGFQNGASTAAFSRRQKLVYKTNLSGAASLTVGLRVRLNATHVLVSASPTFAPANTRIYPVTNGIATGVQIDNTYQYIGFVTPNEGPGLSASNTLELWLKADDVQPGNEPAAGTALRRWQNLSGAAMDFVQRDSEAVPIYSADGMNYHPALRFGASGAPTKLVSSSNFATEASSARRYRSFHVTRFDYKNGNNYGNVFSYRENYSAEGWTNDPSTEAYYSGCGASSNVALRAPALPLEKRFGIMSFDRGTDPNCAALTPPNEAVWYNARPSPINVYSRPITASTTTKAIIGVKNASSDDVYRGDIQEIIILSTPAGSNFAPDDVNKINTYLAVKYGQTLDSLSQPEWKSSDGTVIWSASAAGYTGYCKNVFGIGRDDAFALYQKQSLSEGSSEKITVFLGDPALPALNSQNESTLSNGQFLMFGSNGIVSNNANRVVYSYPAGTAFAGGSLAAALDYRHATVLRARTTGPASSFVANVFAGGLKAEYLLVSSNPAFPAGSSGGTRIYRFDGNNVAATVTINNGDYLAFAYAEKSPGGVSSDMRMWLKADEPSSLDIDGVTGEVQEWRDFSGNSDNIKYLYQNLGSTGPQTRPAFRRIDPAMNYHPAVDFRAFGEYLVTDKAPFSEAKPENFTIVSTVHLRQYGETTGEGNISYLMGFGRKALSTSHGSATSMYHRQPAIGLGVVNNLQGVGRSIYHADAGVNGKFNLYHPKATTVTMHMTYFNKAVTSTTNNDRFVRFEADGMSEEIHNNSDHSGRYQGNQIPTLTRDMLMNGEGTLGSGSRYSRNVMGTMSEIIAYEKLLSDDEKS